MMTSTFAILLASASAISAQLETSDAAKDAAEAVVQAAEAAARDAERVANGEKVTSPQTVETVELVPAPPPVPLSISPVPRPRAKPYWKARPSPADYPPDAWLAGHEGTTRYSVSVDAEGKPTGCEVMESSGFPVLDEVACNVAVDRGEFEPATDEDGNPIASKYTTSYRWRKREPQFPQSAGIKVRFTINTKGEIEDCKVLEKEGKFDERMEKSFEREPCPGSNKRPQEPYRDANGIPIAKRVTVQLKFDVEEPAE